MRIITYVFVFLWYLDFFCKIERSFYRKDKVIRSRRLCISSTWSSAFCLSILKISKNKYFLIAKGYFYTLYLINRQITNLEVVPDTD